jgi:hypothetical protein
MPTTATAIPECFSLKFRADSGAVGRDARHDDIRSVARKKPMPLYRRARGRWSGRAFCAEFFQAGIRARIAERTYPNPWGNVMPTDTKEETVMKHLVLVRAIGIELDSLRGAASRVAGETETEWWTEPRPLGTAFCFESANTRTQFCAICTRHDVDYTTEG